MANKTVLQEFNTGTGGIVTLPIRLTDNGDGTYSLGLGGAGGGAGSFSVGTYASPATATVTGANTFTVPTTCGGHGTGLLNIIITKN